MDLGWSVLDVGVDPLDLNEDGVVNSGDLVLACDEGANLDPYFATLGTLLADVDFDGMVGFSDFLILSGNFGNPGNYSMGNINCNESIDFADFLLLSGAFGLSAAATESVPETNGTLGIGLLVCIFGLRPTYDARVRRVYPFSRRKGRIPVG